MILVTGANGMVGSYVQELFGSEEIVLTDREEMDVTSAPSVKKIFGKVRPQVVLHLAAATDVDRCQTEAPWAHQVNVEGTQNVAAASKQAKAVLVYVSTSSVFDGEEKKTHSEWDVPNPVNTYAQTKLEGEKVVQSFVDRHFIVRAGWMMGGKSRDKKFVSKMVQLCQEKDHMDVVDDKWGTLTYAKDFLGVVKQLLRSSSYGLYHVANEGICSRYDVALEIVKGLRSPVKVRACSSDRFPLPAPRPCSEAIFSHRLRKVGVKPLRAWQEALKEYLKELTKGEV